MIANKNWTMWSMRLYTNIHLTWQTWPCQIKARGYSLMFVVLQYQVFLKLYKDIKLCIFFLNLPNFLNGIIRLPFIDLSILSLLGCQDEKNNSGKSRSLESNQTKIKKWKLQARFYWVYSWEIMKSATSLTPPSTGLSGIQFSILNVLESMILKDQKKIYHTII